MNTRLIFCQSVICLMLLGLLPACGASPAPNLAPNPSFEEAQEGRIRGWQAYEPAVSSWSAEAAHSGTHSICLHTLGPHSSTDWETSELIPVTAGTIYNFSAYVKGDFDREAYLLVFPIDAGGNQMDGISATASFNNTDWSHVRLAVEVPAEAVSVRLDLGANNDSDTATTGMVCFDDVSFG